MKKILFTLLLIGAFVFAGSAFAADNLIKTAKLTVVSPTASVAAGSDVTLPISVSGTDGKAGGVAFTLNYDKAKLGFKSLTKGVPALQDPTKSCNGATAGCDPYNTTDGIVETDPALFYQANDDKNGKVMIAAASAVAVKDGVLFNAVFTVLAGVADGTSDVTATQTSITNEPAGYATSTPIPVLVGMPATAAVDGVYPVTDYYHDKATNASFVTLEKGTVTVAPGYNVGLPKSGDPNNTGNINILDLSIAVGFIGKAKPTEGESLAKFEACDMNGDGKINILDLSSMVGKM